MGRRKIEIKAIKDDRNRSVTFLKRKGGLFKKAHELSVLCSVDVAVIIFGQNKKLYEYSSGNINEFLGRYQYYPGPHEHKGPADFANKGGQDDDDDDEDNIGSPGAEEASPPHHGVVVSQPFHNQPSLQHMRHATASASPPMPNGMFQPQRLSTPQPQSISRPTSRNHSRRPSSNLAPQHHPPPQTSQPAGAPMNYAYQSNTGFYQQVPASGVTGLQPQQGNANMTQHHYSNPVPVQGQMQHLYVPPADNRRQSMPPNFTMQNQERSAQGGMSQIPQRPQRPFHTPPLPEHSTAMAEPRSHSIYTPIDDSRSILAQHWGAANGQPSQRNEINVKLERYVEGPRSQSIDVGSAMRNRPNGTSPRPSFAPPPAAPVRPASVASGGGFGPPLRHDSQSSDVKRPRLKVQIPSEQSDGGSATEETGGSSPRRSGNSNSTPSAKAGAVEGSHASGVVLPPPSPSASALLSAGATGPKNPFARPPPPTSTLNNTTLSYRDSETPLSALPSRFMSDGLLPSPSTFYSDWGFGQVGNNNSLASPAVYQPTPIVNHGPSFRDEDPHNKRKSSEDGDGAPGKRPKS